MNRIMIINSTIFMNIAQSSDEDSDVVITDDEEEDESEAEINNRIAHLADVRKKFLLTKVRPFSDPLTTRKTEVVQTFVDYQSAELLTRYLASKRPFSASFDFFLTRVRIAQVMSFVLTYLTGTKLTCWISCFEILDPERVYRTDSSNQNQGAALSHHGCRS